MFPHDRHYHIKSAPTSLGEMMAMNGHSWPVVKVCSEINHSVQVLKRCPIALAQFSHSKFKTLKQR